MKKLIITPLLLFIFSTAIMAQSSKISVFSEDGEKFWVVINGIRQNDKPQTNVKVEGLDQPNYKVKVIFEDDKIKAVDKSVMTRDVDDKPTYCTYSLRKNKKGEMLLKMNSYQPLEEDNNMKKPEDQAVVTYRTDEKVSNEVSAGGANVKVGIRVEEGEHTDFQPEGMSTEIKTSGNSDGANISIQTQGGADGMQGLNVDFKVVDFKDAASGTSTTTTTKTTTTKTTTTKTGGQVQNTASNSSQENTATKGCRGPVAAADFGSMKASLAKQTFEETRLKVSKDIIKRNCFSTSQVKELMELFTFEKNKLEIAKYSYNFCTDQANYYQLNDAFTFSSSVDELTEFLNGK